MYKYTFIFIYIIKIQSIHSILAVFYNPLNIAVETDLVSSSSGLFISYYTGSVKCFLIVYPYNVFLL